MEAAIFYVILIILNIILTMFPRVPLLNIVFGLIGVSITTLTLSDDTLPGYPYFMLLMLATSVLVIFAAILKLRRGD